MTLLQWYILVGVPFILLAGAFAADRLSAYDSRHADRHTGPAE
ncbi:hypothetical protein Snov_0294 [Ancylobacter novellus DSM 506]|uniref:Uncharacterized protein n=1 Tax=Ancylobacter novellus (strain ATCC 8093 / DSM 506 / JCM 20403 / CCM 1077 / IAM 12100 / NBRC 12443 / NCIMB 10456) TaxID=639283 RepID=D7A212_ANCN5|nr:hypothetical protein [Ancylobacter novellus]ADH87628.1 hypothetical protein Snov_0294 [Ancylobacter novellus DSM 506]